MSGTVLSFRVCSILITYCYVSPAGYHRQAATLWLSPSIGTRGIGRAT